MPGSADKTLAEEAPIVLVIEDAPILRMEVMDLCEEIGLRPLEAAGVDDAIAILESRPDIRIVYMDLDMPRGIDGLKIALAIRDRWPPVEIILTAASLDPRRVGLPARSEFFPKPIDRPGVASTMRQMAEDL